MRTDVKWVIGSTVLAPVLFVSSVFLFKRDPASTLPVKPTIAEVCTESTLPDLTVFAEKGRQKYAIIINGDYSYVHHYNVLNAYNILRDKLSYDDDRIFILSGNNPREAISKENPCLRNRAAARHNIEQLVGTLSAAVDGNDLVVFYLTGHGIRVGDRSYACISGGIISSKEYRELLERIPAGLVISITDQCYSGGFTEELATSHGPFAAVSETNSTETTFCKYYSRSFWEAFADEDADRNHDGRISLGEAHEQAMIEHRDSLRRGIDGQYYSSSGEEVFLD